MVAERPWYIPRKCNASFLLSGVCGCTLRLRCAARFVLRIIYAGILDLEEKQILWIDDLAPSSSDTHIAPKQPAFESGDKLYVKDFNDTLHIYQRE